MPPIIRRYDLQLTASTHRVPVGARFIRCAKSYECVCVWAIVDPTAAKEVRLFSMVPTNTPLNGNHQTYLGTIEEFGGELLLHVFVD